MMNASIDDIIATHTETGRALLKVPGYHIQFLLPCRRRDVREMGKVRQWLVGSSTPGMTWTDGIFLSLFWLGYRLGWRKLEELVHFILHETGHWWQCWRRMRAQHYRLTYGYQLALKMVVRMWRTVFGPRPKQGEMSHPLRKDLIMENEADLMADGMLAAAKQAWSDAGQPTEFIFDTELWLQAHYPAKKR